MAMKREESIFQLLYPIKVVFYTKHVYLRGKLYIKRGKNLCYLRSSYLGRSLNEGLNEYQQSCQKWGQRFGSHYYSKQ